MLRPSYCKKKFSPIAHRLLLLFSLLTLLYVTAIGQQPAYQLPAVVQPSPQSMAFTRYGDYPMTGCNGLTDITLPIHTVTGRKLSIPITMSFHASGRMANEADGILGIRWTLNCGGLVTRTMKGLPDEWNELTRFDIMQNLYPIFDTLYSACPNGKVQYLSYQNPLNPVYPPRYDSEYDIFSYSLPNGKQGHFILRNENGAKVPMMIPYEPLKIETVTSNTTGGYYDNIKITDLDGTQYFFGKIDGSTANAIESTSEPDLLWGQLGGIPTAWYLSKIISADGTDQLTLSYITQARNTYVGIQNANIGDRLRDYNTDLSGNNGDSYEENLKSEMVQWHYEPDWDAWYNTITRYVPTVTGVNFDGGSISFNYSYPQFLTQIVVNRGSTPYKKVTFNCVQHGNQGDLSCLDDIKFYGEDQVTVGEKYSFTYYNDGGGPTPAIGCINKDWWGYYLASGVLLPFQTVNVAPINYMGGPSTQNIGYGVNRTPNEYSASRLGMLKTIIYPTGGKTEFVYELNKYDNASYVAGQNTNLEDGPGLRIKEIISTPVQGVPVHKIYKYGSYEDGRGFINECLRPGSYTWNQITVSEGVNMHFWEFGWGTGLQAGFRSRTFLSDPYINFDLGGTQIKYDAVTEYVMDEDGNNRQKVKTLYQWGDNDQLIDFSIHDNTESNIVLRKFSNPENAWKTPVMTDKEIYKYNSGSFDLLRKETYAYDYLSPTTGYETFDMPTYMHTNIIWARSPNSSLQYSIMKDYDANNCSIYGYGIRHYTTAKQELYSTTVEDFTPSGTITTVKQYEHDDTYNFLVKSEQVTNSKGQVAKTTYTYPSDFPSTTVYQQMVQRNVLAPVISQTTTVANVQMKKTITNYVSPFTNSFVPQSIESKNGGGAQHTIANFNVYDSYGNILEQQKANDVKEVFLWGYGSKYPVAKILGTTYSTASGYVTQSVLDAPSSDASLRTHLNNLRSIPNTLVTTYTYKPLVGITSETDPKGKTIYYEYDNFNRLKVIRDQDGNILKKMDYQFQVPYNQ